MISTAKYYVYKHTFDNGVVYIGKGKDGRIDALKRNRYWTNLYNKYGEPIKEYLAKDLTESIAFTLEKVYIESEKAFKTKLCNMTDGGEGASGYRHTKEAKAKLRKANLGKKLSQETKDKMAKTRSVLSGTINSNGNSYKSLKERAKAGGEAVARKVCQYTLDNKLIAEYDSITEAVNCTGVNCGNISSVCRGRYKQAGGFRWTYKKELDNEKD